MRSLILRNWEEFMGEETPQEKVMRIVREYIDEHLDKSDPPVSYTVYVVLSAYILGSWKATASSSLPDGMYYEVTYDKNADAIYFDAYKKFENRKIVER